MGRTKKATAAILSLLLMIALASVASAEQSYTAGTYEAIADGHNGPVMVSVTFDDAAITDVTVVSHQETAGISDAPIAKFPQQIVESQSLNLDTVSGASFTSRAILSAVADCVVQASGDPAKLLSQSEAPSSKELTAGTYTATRHGHHSDVVVQVKLSVDSIEDIEILEEGETFNLADGAFTTLPARVIEKQSTNIDVVTGATYSSRAVLSAIEDCIEQAGGTAAVQAFSVKIDPEPWSTQEHVVNVDVVVVGSGLSGVSAALSAQDQGASVALVEKLDFFGGTSQTAYGFTVFPSDQGANTQDFIDYSMNKTCGIMDGDTYMDGEYPNLELVTTLAENSYDSVKWLESKGVEIFYANEGPMAANSPYIVQKAGLRLGDMKEPDVMGGVLTKLVEQFVDNGGQLYLSTTAESLITENSDVVGVNARGKNGVYTFNSKGVVLATGGISSSPEMVAKYMPAYIDDVNVALVGNTGDGMRMAIEVGAVPYDNQFMMSCLGHTYITDREMVAPYSDSITSPKSLILSPAGLRTNSETPESYTAGETYMNPNGRDYCWIINNEKIVTEAGYIDLLEDRLAAGDPRFFKSDSIADLANQIRIMPNILRYWLNRYNSFCEAGEDLDYHKDPKNLEAMYEGPWYAVKGELNYLGSVGGVKINKNAEVVNAQNEPIIGLYAAGENASGGFFNLSHTGAVSISNCHTMGQIAGRNAALLSKN